MIPLDSVEDIVGQSVTVSQDSLFTTEDDDPFVDIGGATAAS